MNFESAVAVLVRARDRAEIADVARILCALASAAHALGEFDRRDDSIEAAAELLRSTASAVRS